MDVQKMTFIIRKDESSNKTIRMPNSYISQQEKIAKEKGISFNKLILQCCEYALNHMDNKESTS